MMENFKNEQEITDCCMQWVYLFQKCTGLIEIRAINGTNGHVEQIFLTNDDVFPERLLELNSQGYDIYYGVGTRARENGSKDSVYEIPALWVDIDAENEKDKKNKYHKIFESIVKTRLYPAIIVDSGNGYHLYFLLREPVIISSVQDRVMVEGALRWLADVFGGDNVCDISRIMRMPGFKNLKDKNNPKSCTIFDIREKCLYDIKDFDSIVSPEPQTQQITLGDLPAKLPTRFVDLLKSDSKLNNTWLGNRPDLRRTTGSELDLALASMLIRKDFINEEIAVIIMNAPYEKKTARTKAYLEHTIGKARSSYDSFHDKFPQSKTGYHKLSQYSLKPEDFERNSLEYLIADFLPKNSLMLITSNYGVGKSILSLALAKLLILSGKVVIIVDADMPREVIFDRLDKARLKSELSSKLIYLHSTTLFMKINTSDESWDMFKNYLTEGDYVVVFDNFKELAPIGSDLDRDGDVIPIMNELKKIRNMGNTVILLHHVTKEGNQKHPFKNSGSIADAVDVAFNLQRNNDEFALRCFKDRIPVNKNIKFIIQPDFSLVSKESEKDIRDHENIIKIYEYLKEPHERHTQKDIIQKMSEMHGMSKFQAMKALENGKGVYWDVDRGSKNSYIFTLIENPSLKFQNSSQYTQKQSVILENTDQNILEIIETGGADNFAVDNGENLRMDNVH